MHKLFEIVILSSNYRHKVYIRKINCMLRIESEIQNL